MVRPLVALINGSCRSNRIAEVTELAAITTEVTRVRGETEVTEVRNS